MSTAKMTKIIPKQNNLPSLESLFHMEKRINAIKIYYDNQGNTLNVWFGNPKDEHLCEETGEEVILAKDKSGKVIGFEKLNFLPIRDLPVEVSLT